MSEISLIYTTFSDEESAQKLTSQLLEEKLIACANIFPVGISIYEWEGKVETAKEVTCILKTRKDSVDKLKTRYLELHSFECPCFVELKVDSVHAAFGTWVNKQVIST